MSRLGLAKRFHPLLSRFAPGARAQEFGVAGCAIGHQHHHLSFPDYSSQRGRAFTTSDISFVETTAGCLAGLEELTGLPCWASISLATVALRVGLLPFTIKQRQAVSVRIARRGQNAFLLVLHFSAANLCTFSLSPVE